MKAVNSFIFGMITCSLRNAKTVDMFNGKRPDLGSVVVGAHRSMNRAMDIFSAFRSLALISLSVGQRNNVWIDSERRTPRATCFKRATGVFLAVCPTFLESRRQYSQHFPDVRRRK